MSEECSVYGCSYLCANQFRELIGVGYWNKVINKEDFADPRPVYGYSNRISNCTVLRKKTIAQNRF